MTKPSATAGKLPLPLHPQPQPRRMPSALREGGFGRFLGRGRGVGGLRGKGAVGFEANICGRLLRGRLRLPHDGFCLRGRSVLLRGRIKLHGHCLCLGSGRRTRYLVLSAGLHLRDERGQVLHVALKISVELLQLGEPTVRRVCCSGWWRKLELPRKYPGRSISPLSASGV